MTVRNTWWMVLMAPSPLVDAPELVGETTDQVWGVVDFIVVIDFPDIRKRYAIHSDIGFFTLVFL